MMEKEENMAFIKDITSYLMAGRSRLIMDEYHHYPLSTNSRYYLVINRIPTVYKLSFLILISAVVVIKRTDTHTRISKILSNVIMKILLTVLLIREDERPTKKIEDNKY